MAHGKIRVNTLTYDTGSGDVDVAVSTIPDATDMAAKANVASPTLTGTPAAPTAPTGTNTTQIATTAFVAAANQAKADLVSPQFSGTPQAPNAAVGTNSTQLATTAYVQAEVGQSIQAHDTDTAKTDVAQTYTAAQRGDITELSGTSFTLDLNASNNFKLSPSGTFTVALSNLAAAAEGQTGSIFIVYSGTESGTFPTTMKFVGGAAGITLTSTAGAIDRIDYIVMNSTTVTCNVTTNYVA